MREEPEIERLLGALREELKFRETGTACNLLALAARRWGRLCLNTNHLPRSDGRDCGQASGNKRQQVFERIARSAEYDHAKTPVRDVLLKLEILVAGHEHREPSVLGLSKQCPFLETCPRFLLNSTNVVADQVRRWLPRKLLIKQNAHERSGLREPLPTTRPLALGRHSETSRETLQGCGFVRGSRSGCGTARASRQKQACRPEYPDRCEQPAQCLACWSLYSPILAHRPR